MRTRSFAAFTALLCLASCSADANPETAPLSAGCVEDATAAADTTAAIDTKAPEESGLSADAVAMDAAINCEPPDTLVLLDRTMTMHFRADGTETPLAENDVAGRKKTKFAIAIEALRGMLATYDTQVRFGVELWPRERDGCLLVKERIDIQDNPGAPPRPGNTHCERGEIKSPPGLGNGVGTAPLIDVETTPLCLSTPMGAALDTAAEYLATIKKVGRGQFLILITDGADYDLSCPSPTHPDPIGNLHQLAEAGIKTFVIGFGADFAATGNDPLKLNKLACAAQTAKNFATTCKKSAAGPYEPVDTAASAQELYFEATDKASLDGSLGTIAASLGCRSCLK